MRNKILFIIVVIAIFVAGWIGYDLFFGNDDDSEDVVVHNINRAPQRGFSRMVSILELDENQEQKFREIEVDYRDSIFVLMRSIRELEAAILDELSVENPSSIVLDRYAEEIGETHAAVKRLTIGHFMMLKELCTPEQAERLSGLFSDMQRGFGRGQFHSGGQGAGRGERMRRNCRIND